MGVKRGVYKMQNWTCKYEAQSSDQLENRKLQLSVLSAILCIPDCSINVFRFKLQWMRSVCNPSSLSAFTDCRKAQAASWSLVLTKHPTFKFAGKDQVKISPWSSSLPLEDESLHSWRLVKSALGVREGAEPTQLKVRTYCSGGHKRVPSSILFCSWVHNCPYMMMEDHSLPSERPIVAWVQMKPPSELSGLKDNFSLVFLLPSADRLLLPILGDMDSR